MWVLSQDRLTLINVDKFSIVKKCDSPSGYNIYSNGTKLGTYPTIEDAKKVLHELFIDIVEEKKVSIMPLDNKETTLD